MKNKRLALALTTALLFIIGVIFAFNKITNSKIDGAYSVHRRAFLFNEKLGRALFTKTRPSVKKETPSGRSPRVNGDLGLRSDLKMKDYKILIESGSKKFSLTPAEFYLLPKQSETTDFRCIEGWSEVTQYAGASFAAFMERYQIGKKTDGTFYSYVALETPDEKYYVSIDMESMLHPQTLLAYEMNLKPLSIENGYPLRLLIPIKYGIKSLKRVGKITFSDTRPRDFWAEQGYDWYSGL